LYQFLRELFFNSFTFFLCLEFISASIFESKPTSIPSSSLSSTTQITNQASSGSMIFGLTDMDEQLIQDWISILLHLSKPTTPSPTPGSSSSLKNSKKKTNNNSNYNLNHSLSLSSIGFNASNPFQERITNFLEGEIVWKELPLKDRLICLRGMKLLRKAMASHNSSSSSEEETKSHSQEEAKEQSFNDFLSFLNLQHCDLNQKTPKPNGELSRVSSNNSLSSITGKMNLLSPANLSQWKHSDSFRYQFNIFHNDSDSESPATKAEPIKKESKLIEKEEEEWKESLNPSFPQLIQAFHDFLLSLLESHLKTVTTWLSLQSLSIFQQLLDQYGEERVIIETTSVSGKKSTLLLDDVTNDGNINSSSAQDLSINLFPKGKSRSPKPSRRLKLSLPRKKKMKIRRNWKSFYLQLIQVGVNFVSSSCRFIFIVSFSRNVIETIRITVFIMI
jgi:hypothetical protein